MEEPEKGAKQQRPLGPSAPRSTLRDSATLIMGQQALPNPTPASRGSKAVGAMLGAWLLRAPAPHSHA